MVRNGGANDCTALYRAWRNASSDNTLRRLGKPVVMLQYTGENHGLRVPANQKDYTVRMKEFFNHRLKGEPTPPKCSDQWEEEPCSRDRWKTR